MSNKGYNRYNHKNSSVLTPRQRQIIGRKIVLVLSVLIIAFTIICMNGMSVKSKAADNYNKYYTSVAIMPGDTLSSYYRTYGEHYDNMKDYVEEVYMINDLTSDKLTAGSYIILPYYSTEIK